MNKARSTILAVVAILMTPMAANADLIQDLDLQFGSGAIFEGAVRFDDVTGAMLDVDGTITGGYYGNIDINWSWWEGTGQTNPQDRDGVGITLEDFLMDGSPISGHSNFIAISWFWDNQAVLNLNTTLGYRSINREDPIVRGKFSSVPEPGTLALFSLGLLGIGAAKRRKAAA